MQRHMRTKPEFSASHSLQIVPIPTTSPLPAPACAGGQPQVSSQLKQSTRPGKRREGPIPGLGGGARRECPGACSFLGGDLDCLGGKRVERYRDSLKFDALTPP